MQKQWGEYTMILYHGSNILVENVDLSKCRPYKDFGTGFYCTTIKEQAEQVAIRVSKIFGGGTYNFEI